HDVLADAVAPVDVQLDVQIVADAAGRDFRSQLGRPLDEVVRGDPRLTAPGRVYEQEPVRLRLVIDVQPGGGVVSDHHAGRCGLLPWQVYSSTRVTTGSVGCKGKSKGMPK